MTKNLWKLMSMLLVVLMAGFGTVACGDDDDDDEDTTGLVGTWTTSQNYGNEVYTQTITFNADGSGLSVETVTYKGRTETEQGPFNWSVNGNVLTVIIQDHSSYSGTRTKTRTFTYSIAGNTLTVVRTDKSYDNETMVFTRK